jgi:hypothetical protein
MARRRPETAYPVAAAKEEPMRYLVIHWTGKDAPGGVQSAAREHAIIGCVCGKRG